MTNQQWKSLLRKIWLQSNQSPLLPLYCFIHKRVELSVQGSMKVDGTSVCRIMSLKGLVSLAQRLQSTIFLQVAIIVCHLQGSAIARPFLTVKYLLTLTRSSDFHSTHTTLGTRMVVQLHKWQFLKMQLMKVCLLMSLWTQPVCLSQQRRYQQLLNQNLHLRQIPRSTTSWYKLSLNKQMRISVMGSMGT